MNISELRELVKTHPKRIGGWTRENVGTLAQTKEINWMIYKSPAGVLGASVGDGHIYGVKSVSVGVGPKVLEPDLSKIHHDPLLDKKRLKTPAHGVFSWYSFQAFDLKWKHQFAKNSAKIPEFGSYEAAYTFAEQSQVDFPDGTAKVFKTWFTSSFSILCRLDPTPPAGASCDLIELSLSPCGIWTVDIGHPSLHKSFEFEDLGEAVIFGLKVAERIDNAPDPSAELFDFLVEG